MRDDELKDIIRDRLVQCRKEKDMTQTDVGKVVGKSKNAVASWEQGLSMPDASTLYRLSLYYQKTIAYMYGEDS
jgi:transcriptional regulator with XRE-family HTH domain